MTRRSSGVVRLRAEAIERGQADADTIAAFTITCLGIEAALGVDYGGWGYVAQTGTSH